MDYLNYVLIVLAIGLVCLFIVRLATRSKNPDLLLQYQARKKAARKMTVQQTSDDSDFANPSAAWQGTPVIKSQRERLAEKTHYRTPWGWPSVERQNGSQGVSEAVRNFTDRLVKEKQLLQPGGSNAGKGSIRALLEDRYGPVNRDMTEIPYQKVKRPLLRDPSEQHDQLDNLGSAESRRVRQKLQFLSAMNNVEDGSGSAAKGTKKVEFRYVELKDLKQPWGW